MDLKEWVSFREVYKFSPKMAVFPKKGSERDYVHIRYNFGCLEKKKVKAVKKRPVGRGRLKGEEGKILKSDAPCRPLSGRGSRHVTHLRTGFPLCESADNRRGRRAMRTMRLFVGGAKKKTNQISSTFL